jgi:hypothetical protein
MRGLDPRTGPRSSIRTFPAKRGLENLGDEEMIFNTIEFLDSPNKPLPVPDGIRLAPR